MWSPARRHPYFFCHFVFFTDHLLKTRFRSDPEGINGTGATTSGSAVSPNAPGDCQISQAVPAGRCVPTQAKPAEQAPSLTLLKEPDSPLNKHLTRRCRRNPHATSGKGPPERWLKHEQ